MDASFDDAMRERKDSMKNKMENLTADQRRSTDMSVQVPSCLSLQREQQHVSVARRSH